MTDILKAQNGRNNQSNFSPLHIAGGTKKRNHFKLQFMPELLSLNIEPNWLIENFIERDTTGVLYGQSGSYKTFLALDWCLSVATGKSWHGLDVNQGLVVYVAGEGNHGVQKRVKAWLKHHGYNDGSEVPFAASNQRVAVLNTEELSVFRHQLDQIQEPIKLVVFDTLRKCFGRGDENHSKDMGEFLDYIENIRYDYNTTCLVVHHTNKSKVIRGSNALESDVDFVYKLESKQKLSCVLHAEKLKDSDAPLPKQFDLNNVYLGSQKGKPINSLVLEPADYNQEPETCKPQGIRGIVFDYILANCTAPMTWTDLISGLLDSNSGSDDEQLTKTNIRTALNGLKDNRTPLLDFAKLNGQNAVRAVSEG
ncbi:AAA family ATPase [Marinicella marina]|uniref:AAA family ATPase n=1 Tax=Marinicella marina TaxID=2996016 RepID=UPI0024BC2DB5|nr:AAA family ATPase [Marinicella marina]MDJ1138749.1 AAA family ATPase [Marinicella marina]